MHVSTRFLLSVALAAGGAAAAQEFVHVSRPLTDDEFYRAVACAAPPGGECRKPFLRWPEGVRGSLGVGLASVTAGVPEGRRRLFEAAIEAAIAEVNALGSGIRLRLAEDRPAISVHVVDAPIGGAGNADLPVPDGAVPPLARVALRAAGGTIREATIAVSAEAERGEIASILLEEIVQALGLMTDLAGPGTRGSIFAEDANTVTRLSGQDAMALRRHYTPN